MTKLKITAEFDPEEDFTEEDAIQYLVEGGFEEIEIKDA